MNVLNHSYISYNFVFNWITCFDLIIIRKEKPSYITLNVQMNVHNHLSCSLLTITWFVKQDFANLLFLS